jgi:hypothetical protein
MKAAPSESAIAALVPPVELIFDNAVCAARVTSS